MRYVNHRSRCSLRSVHRAAARCAQSASPVGSCVYDHDRRLTASRACSIATTRFRNARLGRIEHGSSARSLSSAPILLASGFAAPVTREKSQFRAQHDSLSLSPAHDSTSLFPNFRALGRPFPLGGLFFAPAFTRERMNAGHLLQSSRSSRFTAGAAGVFELEAVRRSSGSGRRVLALRHHAFQAHLAAWANTTFFSGEEKRVPGPARAQGSRTRQSRLSLGRPFVRGFHKGTTGPPFDDPVRLALVFCGAARAASRVTTKSLFEGRICQDHVSLVAFNRHRA